MSSIITFYVIICFWFLVISLKPWLHNLLFDQLVVKDVLAFKHMYSRQVYRRFIFLIENNVRFEFSFFFNLFIRKMPIIMHVFTGLKLMRRQMNGQKQKDAKNKRNQSIYQTRQFLFAKAVSKHQLTRKKHLLLTQHVYKYILSLTIVVRLYRYQRPPTVKLTVKSEATPVKVLKNRMFLNSRQF